MKNGLFSDNLTQSLASIVSEIQEGKKAGTKVVFTNQDGDETRGVVKSFDKKKGLYTLTVKGNDVEVEPEEIKEGKFSELDLEYNEIVDWLIGLIKKGHVKSKKDVATKLKELGKGMVGTTWSKSARQNDSEIMSRLDKAMGKQKVKLKESTEELDEAKKDADNTGIARKLPKGLKGEDAIIKAVHAHLKKEKKSKTYIANFMTDVDTLADILSTYRSLKEGCGDDHQEIGRKTNDFVDGHRKSTVKKGKNDDGTCIEDEPVCDEDDNEDV